MAVCSLCSTIPFGSLPDPPSYKGWTRTHDHNECPWLAIDPSQKEPHGFPWHRDLASLAAGSSFCPLCAVVEQGFQKWLGHFEESGQNAFFAEFKDTYNEVVPHGQRLYLTKRIGGSPGFIVLAREPGSYWTYLLTGVVFSVSKDNPAFPRLKLQPPDLDSGSAYSMEMVASLLTACQETHGTCARRTSMLPSRVLDTGLSEDMVKLEEPKGQSGTYACLSHCWGGKVALTTTMQTFQNRRSGIPLTELPKTFLDAVKLVRYLRIRYLWIDSLCIVQDDADDWARESACMHAVYSNAFLTIAANHATSPSDGCFHIRSPRTSCTIDLPGYASNVHIELLFPSDEKDWDQGEFLSEPLSKRGWALQERFLSQRTLLYNNRQIYYECRNGIVGEDGCRRERMLCSLDTLSGLNKDNMKQNHNKQQSTSNSNDKAEIENKALALWHSLVSNFGGRSLTKASDKLPAISGLSKLLESHLRCHYIAGYWSNSLIQSISWVACGNAKTPGPYIGPSWSWVSYPGPTGNTNGFELRDVAQLLQWKVSLKNESNPYGEVNSAWLRIRGPLFLLLPATVDYTENDLRRQKVGLKPHPVLRTPYTFDDGELVDIELDYEDVAWSGKWKEMKLHVLILSANIQNSSESATESDNYNADRSYNCLVIAFADSQQSGLMERVGRASLKGPLAKRALLDETNRRDVVLV